MTTVTESTIKLTEKQERFCIEYVLNKGNGKDAAERAGYSTASQESLAVEASRLLRNVNVISKIAELREQTGIKTGVNIEWLTSVLVSAIETSLTNEDSKGVALNSSVLMKLMGWDNKTTPDMPIKDLANRIIEQRQAMKQA